MEMMENDMTNRENIICRYFRCWLNNTPELLGDLLAMNVDYRECWGPRYHGLEQVRRWFTKWNELNKVLQWDCVQFIHEGNMAAVEWVFQYQDRDGLVRGFDGVSLVRFSPINTIVCLKEYGAKSPTYSPFD